MHKHRSVALAAAAAAFVFLALSAAGVSSAARQAEPPTLFEIKKLHRIHKSNTFKFKWKTRDVTNMAKAEGDGWLTETSPTTALFLIAGKGTHPAYGKFAVDADGDVMCAGGQGMEANAQFRLRFRDGSPDDEGTVFLAKCETDQECPPGGET